MRVGIVTVHNSHNCGSYLQAYALCEYIRSLGYDARFVKNKIHPQSSFFYRLMMSTKYFFKGQFRKSFGIIKGSLVFIKARKKFLFFSRHERIDVCVYGSDTIWNLNSSHLRKNWQHYFGKCFSGKKIAYAPSIGETSAELIIENDVLCQCIKDFSSIGVRDCNTYQMVETVTQGSLQIQNVVDPTMLMYQDFYEGIATKCQDEKFVLFYYFGVLDEAYMKEIKKYAKANGYQLISFGDGIKNVDKTIPFNPLDMMVYFIKADLIITNTFHGNVFSLIFNKPFVNIDAGKIKVDDLLKKIGVSDRTAKQATDFAHIVSQPIDYETVNVLLEDARNTSKEYLKNALRKCEKEMNHAC